jgi:hypothetical protein
MKFPSSGPVNFYLINPVTKFFHHFILISENIRLTFAACYQEQYIIQNKCLAIFT